jgi:hypothetical protein
VRRLERNVERARGASGEQRLRGAFLVLALAALTHFALSIPAPAPARSAWPIATPLVVAVVAVVAAFGITSNRRS